jgi:hypothetical protein
MVDKEHPPDDDGPVLAGDLVEIAGLERYHLVGVDRR